MSGIQNLLQYGQQALQAHQGRMAVTQQNVANAATDGYRRQTVSLTDQGSLGGLQLGTRQSVTAMMVDSQLSEQLGHVAFSSARAEVGEMVELASSASASHQDAIADFFGSAQTLAANPNGTPERAEFLANTEALAARFREQNASLEDARIQVDRAIDDLGSEINEKLSLLASYDRQVRDARASGAPYGEFMDARDRLVGEVSESLGTRVSPQADGSLYLSLPNGQALVEGGRARSLRVIRNAQGVPGVQIQHADGGYDVEVGGRIGGLLDGRARIEERSGKLDQMAFDFATAANDVHRQGFGRDGSTGRALFAVSASVDGAAGSIHLHADLEGSPERLAVSAVNGARGDTGAIRDMISLRDQTLSSGETLSEQLRSLDQHLAHQIAADRSTAQAGQDKISNLEQLQASVSGVSLEEEMIAMTQSKQAYEAAARIVQVGDQMMETLLSLKA